MTLTSDIATCPESVQRYIRELETIADPAGLVREVVVARENAVALVARVKELEASAACACGQPATTCRRCCNVAIDAAVARAEGYNP